MNAKGAATSEIDLLELFRIVWGYRWALLVGALAAAGLATVAAFLMTPKYRAEAAFLVREEQKAGPLDAWGSLAQQFGYKIKDGADPLLSMVGRVIRSEAFYRPFLAKSLDSASPDSSVARLLKVDSLPEEDRLEALADRISRSIKLEEGANKDYTLRVTTPNAHLSQFLANEIIEGLNAFFLERQARNHRRKLEFLQAELVKNRQEMDSASNNLRIFLEANKDFSTPLLAFRYQKLKQSEMVYTEKFMITMKAYQSQNIGASQPEFFFEPLEQAKLPRSPSHPKKPLLIGGAFTGALVLGAILVVLFRWLLVVGARQRAA